MSDESAPHEPWLLYDGECPFCASYVRFVRLRDVAGPVRMVNARDGGPEVEAARRMGFDLDEGMVLRLSGRYYHGKDCINALALMSSRSTVFNSVNHWVFRSPRRAALLYPVLRAGRNAVLRLLGRRRLSA